MKRIDRAITSLLALGWVVCCNHPLELTNGKNKAVVRENGDVAIVE